MKLIKLDSKTFINAKMIKEISTERENIIIRFKDNNKTIHRSSRKLMLLLHKYKALN